MATFQHIHEEALVLVSSNVVQLPPALVVLQEASFLGLVIPNLVLCVILLPLPPPTILEVLTQKVGYF